ncbi:MAG TPA: SDR family NAD(P)-dependent oxidoreductase [Gemmatales bacterium]|nr:SDR family NAD(P)-dependent oxidoreductase [Gemmatales bacterium]
MAAPASAVAIVGIGCLFPKAPGHRAFWANILRGVDAVGPVPPSHFQAADYLDADPKAADRIYTARGGFLDPVDFPPLDFGITPNSLEATDPTQLLGLWVARAALHDAGFGPQRPFDRSRASVILGVTGTLPLVIPLGARLGHPLWKQALAEAGVPESQAQAVMDRIAKGYVGWQEESFPGLLGNVVAGRIANRLDFGGTNCVVDAACASSLSALHLALLELQSGRSDLVLSGGMDCFNDVFMFMCFSKTPALSPSGDVRPFDAAGDGTILGEGLGCVALKRLADAERDGDRIYAVLRAVGTSSDGKGTAIYAPNPAGQARALQLAYESAGVTPDTIELLEAHGTGTKAGDLAEITALIEVYRRRETPDGPQAGPWCALGSIKSQIGHTKAAAGIAGLIKAALALHHRTLPPTIKVRTPLEPLRTPTTAFYVNTQPRPWVEREQPRRAAVSSFGFGGSNFHCVLEEHPKTPSPVAWDRRLEILPLSAPSKADLRTALQRLGAASQSDWPRVCAESRQRFDAGANARLVLVLNLEEGPVGATLAAAERMLAEPDWPAAQARKQGVFLGLGPRSGKLGLLFPGQGSQYVGMLRELACRFPSFRTVIEVANRMPTPLGQRLSDLLYPHPAWDDATRAQQEGDLRRTDVTQPALAAVESGCLRVLKLFGISADAWAGHSFGELTALHAAGCFDADELVRLAALRGRLLAEASGGHSGMTAIRFDGAAAKAMLSHFPTLHLANDNAPRQVVVAGPLADLAAFEERCAAEGYTAVRLPVSAGFHTPSLASAHAPLAEAARAAVTAAPARSVYANATAAPYPASADAIADLLGQQLHTPVQFRTMVERMAADGIATFVEVGPGNKLTGLVEQILAGRNIQALALDASTGKQTGLVDLARLLAQLAALGHAVDWTAWNAPLDEQALPSKAALTVPISGALYRRPEARSPAPAAAPIVETKVASPPTSPRASLVTAPTPPQPESPQLVLSKPEAPTIQPNPPRPAAATSVATDVLLALQKMAEQTAQLHRQFLEGQERALAIFQQLFTGQAKGSLPSNAVPAQVAAPAPTPALPASITSAPAPTSVPSLIPVLPSSPPPKPAEIEPALASVASMETVQAPSEPASLVTDVLRAIVAEKTGYPPEMLGLEMELDADLGIDSIKRVEIFAAVQERLPAAPAMQPDQLGRLRTLRDVVNHLDGAPRSDSRPTQPVATSPAAPLPTAAPAVQETLIAIVAAKTGYPAEMLGLDMELDVDLGIDSIKRVEIFAAVQEQLPGTPAIKPELLGSLRTLRQVVEHLGGPSGHTTTQPASTLVPNLVPPETAPPSPSIPAPALARYVPKLVEAPVRGERLTGVETGLWWLVEDEDGLTAALAQALRDQGLQARLASAAELIQSPESGPLAGIVLTMGRNLARREALAANLALVQRARPILQTGAVMAAITRLDGGMGWLEGPTMGQPVSAALGGLVKTLRHEWPGLHCKIIDLPATLTDRDRLAHELALEVTHAGPLEVGLDGSARRSQRLEAEPLPDEKPDLNLAAEDVVVITGGARGVTAACALALARHAPAQLVLLGRTPLPGPEPGWMTPLQYEAEIRAALVGQLAAAGWGPRQLADEVRRLSAERELRTHLERLHATGRAVHYQSVDVRDPIAVRTALADVRSRLGPIRALVHGAGVLADRRIEDLTADDLERVFATKVLGLDHLLAAVPADELRALIVFSSTTARFGRTGQAAYAMANEVLNKMACALRKQRPTLRTLALGWGPWDGGMVTDALRPLFAREGIGLIPLQAGAEHLLREWSHAAPTAEVLVLGSPLPETWLTPEPASEAIVPAEPLPTADAVEPGSLPLLKRSIGVAEVPVLRDHVLKHRAVVPAALLIDWLAQAALQRHPGLAFHALEGFHVLRGITLGADERRQLELETGTARRKNGTADVDVRLVTRQGSERLVHAHAQATLLAHLPTPPTDQRPTPQESQGLPFPGNMERLYQDWLFHGPALRCISQVRPLASDGLEARVRLAPPPREWLTQPWRSQWLCDPLALDAGFQLAIIWTQWRRHMPCLPTGFARYRQYVRQFPGSEVLVRLEAVNCQGARLEARLTWTAGSGQVLAEMEGFEAVLDAGLATAFRQNTLAQPAHAL